jgi:hypothetical protein
VTVWLSHTSKCPKSDCSAAQAAQAQQQLSLRRSDGLVCQTSFVLPLNAPLCRLLLLPLLLQQVAAAAKGIDCTHSGRLLHAQQAQQQLSLQATLSACACTV